MNPMPDINFFNALWQYFLSEGAEQLLHVWGTAMAIVFVTLLIWSGDLQFLAAAAVARHGTSWLFCWMIERTCPAMFSCLIRALMSCYRKYFLACGNCLEVAVKRHAIKSGL